MSDSDYGYKALQVLWIDQVRAHNPGDWVPAENVELHEWEEGVDVERCLLPTPDPEEGEASAPKASQPPESPGSEEPDESKKSTEAGLGTSSVAAPEETAAPAEPAPPVRRRKPSTS